ncbi:hypothetical protein EON65_09495 [archaeon]|nr:MAG: hypothetical protein EON65_09495 [archaeon]
MTGTTIAHIRSASNVHIRGTDITEEQRLVFLHGTLEQVLSAFDMISEVSALQFNPSA